MDFRPATEKSAGRGIQILLGRNYPNTNSFHSRKTRNLVTNQRQRNGRDENRAFLGFRYSLKSAEEKGRRIGIVLAGMAGFCLLYLRSAENECSSKFRADEGSLIHGRTRGGRLRHGLCCFYEGRKSYRYEIQQLARTSVAYLTHGELVALALHLA